MSTNDGGPAFPVPADHFEQRIHPDWRGMTLRDYFAGQAIIAVHQADRIGYSDEEDAQAAYRLADAMIAARERKT